MPGPRARRARAYGGGAITSIQTAPPMIRVSSVVAILRLCSRSSGYFFIPAAAIFMNSSVMNVFGSGFSLSVPAEMK